MRKLTLVAGLAAAALFPSLVAAQPSCDRQRDTRVVGTVAGAGVGALLGSAIAGHRDRTAGAVIGGLSGAIVGNQVSKPQADCAHAYGYYDRNSQWHAYAVDRADATGYYDRDGAWIDGAPNGYYDQSGRWISAKSDAPGAYRDSQGGWIATSSNASGDDPNRSYERDRNPPEMRRDLNTRETWLDGRIRAGGADGTLSRHDMRHDLRELTSIRRQDAHMRSGDGQLSQRDEVYLQARLDRLAASLRHATNDDRGGY